jgi:hypothetical protein
MPKYTPEQAIRQAFNCMDQDKAQAIREAYYKAIEGLYGLESELVGTVDPLLANEYAIAIKALSSLRQSQLGKVL